MREHLPGDRSVPEAPVGAAPISSPRPLLKKSWVEERGRAVSTAIAFLKARCILVTLRSREDPIAVYKISGRAYLYYAEDVIALADRIHEEEARAARVAARKALK